MFGCTWPPAPFRMLDTSSKAPFLSCHFALQGSTSSMRQHCHGTPPAFGTCRTHDFYPCKV